ncbi:MAG: TRAP transporter small permease subunit [Burkholderiales bacterium]
MRQTCRAIELAVEAVAAAMVLVFAVVILADVVCRYWLHIPIAWVSEFTVLLFQCTAFLGSTLALRRGLHFGIGLVVSRAFPKLGKLLGFFVAAVVTASSMLLLVLAIRMVRQTWDATYATLQISHGWEFVAVAFSAGLMALFGLEQGLRVLRPAAAKHAA